MLAIYDQDIATVFAIEAASLVDHFHFRNRTATGKMNLYTDSKWAQAYFNTNDLHCDDRPQLVLVCNEDAPAWRLQRQ